jgi:azurin
MKLTLKTLLLSALITSCGSNNNEEKIDNSLNESKEIVTEKEKVWNEFTINAIGNTMSEMKYDIGNITVEEGEWVRITLVNKGIDVAMQHNIVFINYGTRKEIATESIEAGMASKYVPKNSNVIAASDLAKPGDSVVLEFKAPKKGNYEYLCTYPGHTEIMRGYFFVK